MRRASIFFAGAGLLAVFIFFSFLVDKNIFRQFDFDTTVRLQDNIPRRFDDFFSFFSDIGTFEVATIVLLVLLIFAKTWRALFAIPLYGVFHVIEIFGKITVEQLPPPEFMLRTKRIIEFPRFHIREEYSYPSGHAGRAVFLTVFLGLLLLRTKKLSHSAKILLFAGLLMYDGLMLLSRPYLGEHWITDVIGGAMLGASLGIIAFVFI